MTARARLAPLVAAILVAGAASVASAQSVCNASAPTARVASRHWPSPLDRQVTLEGKNVTLRDGLAQLASAARVRLSYVSELLPLDRSLCLSYRAVAAGEVLADLLRGTDVEPVVAGDNQVVLAPARRSASAVVDSASLARTSVLERVVVMGTSSTVEERAKPISVDIVNGQRLARQETRSLSHLIDGSVPGIWLWQQSPATLFARYGSVRGASSFGLSYPKIYIDGIEVANPLLVRQIDPSTIERLEVIRGPQGSALYGADANGGVINILTRHDGAGAGGHKLELESTAGMSGSQFATQGVVTQQHALAFRTGTNERSGGLGFSMGTLGAYVPGAFARTVAANGDLRLVGARSVLTGTARFFSERAGTPSNPLLPHLPGMNMGGVFPNQAHGGDGRPAYARTGPEGSNPGPLSSPFGTQFSNDTTATQSVRQYTLGGTLAFTPNDRWTHTFVLGVDGYRLANPAVTEGPIPTATDSALTAARGGSDRVTARMTSETRIGVPERLATDLSFVAEYSTAREQSSILTSSVTQTPSTTGGPRLDETLLDGEAKLIGWRGNTGLVAQSTTSLRNRLFLTAGMRVERNDALVGSTRLTTLPMLGGAIVGDRGDVTLKVRAAYGKGIRPVQGAIRELAWTGHRTALVAYDLTPEEQAGIEAGADLFVGRNLGFHVTRFDQQATGLIQSVAVTVPGRASSRGARSESGTGGASGANGASDSYVAYQLQNVGAISNRGWELQSSATLGRLSLTGTLSLVDSRVRRLAAGYSGDLRGGDRMLDVPSRTTSVSGAWTGRGWFSSLTLSRAADWMGYDRLAVASALTSGGLAPRDLVGNRLRGYWREYDGVTRLRANFSRDVFRGLSLVLAGDNLLGQQRGEPDNATVVPGRTVTAGLKAKF
ncbi:MAG TPA: TonB-dependent receptor plug domain-containing protein [Gemmatimonadaceae bacterium]|nr:TonB-dependent receptor plug domain-containing protein [Gemmatimonadaceae bacterium]